MDGAPPLIHAPLLAAWRRRRRLRRRLRGEMLAAGFGAFAGYWIARVVDRLHPRFREPSVAYMSDAAELYELGRQVGRREPRPGL